MIRFTMRVRRANPVLMQMRMGIWVCLALSSCQILGSCGTSELTKKNLDKAQMYENNPETLYPVVLDEAKELEGKVLDGWFFGSDSRSLKSGYTKASSELKAQFACDSMKMLADQHEDLTRNWQSYVPYSAREKFARAWWSDAKHSVTFQKEPYYKQIIWLHEALMDGSELWWRALEKQCPEGVASTSALAHDAEQQMVSKYKENESSPEKSFSSFAPEKQAKGATKAGEAIDTTTTGKAAEHAEPAEK